MEILDPAIEVEARESFSIVELLDIGSDRGESSCKILRFS